MTEVPPYRQEVVRARRRGPPRATLLRLIAVVAVGHALVLGALVGRERTPPLAPPAPAAVLVPLAPVVVARPAPAPAVAARPACPLERHDAPAVQPELPEAIEHVRPSRTNAGWIAAWNAAHVFVSRDAGATFQRVLDGDGAVRAAAFDCYGHLFVARDGWFGVQDGARHAWRAAWYAPGATALVGDGPDIAVIGGVADSMARVAVSADLGETWQRFDDVPLPEGGVRVSGSESAAGVLDAGIAIPDCRDTDVVWLHLAHGRLQTAHFGIGEGSPFGLIGAYLYADGVRGMADDAERSPIAGFPAERAIDAVDGPAPLFVVEQTAYRVAGLQARALPWLVDGAPQATDAAGRLWVIACGEPHVAGRAGVRDAACARHPDRDPE